MNNFKHRPLSWSQISCFHYNPEEWFSRYVKGEKTPPNKEMLFGKYVGDKLASDPTFLPQVPRLSKYEHELRVVFNGIHLIGFMDNFCDQSQKVMYEFKTGKRPWNQKRVDEHGQIDMYALMHFITTKIPPEQMDFKLVWLPTKESGDFSISLIEPVVPQIFTTKRTTADILRFGAYINDTVKAMASYPQPQP